MRLYSKQVIHYICRVHWKMSLCTFAQEIHNTSTNGLYHIYTMQSIFIQLDICTHFDWSSQVKSRKPNMFSNINLLNVISQFL